LLVRKFESRASASSQACKEVSRWKDLRLIKVSYPSPKSGIRKIFELAVKEILVVIEP